MMAHRGLRIVLSFLAAWLAAQNASADFVEIGRLLDEPAAKLSEALRGKTAVVAVRGRTVAGAPWDVGQAAGVELTEALRRRQIDAVRAAADARLSGLEAGARAFHRRDAQMLKRAGREVLIGIEWIATRPARLKIAAFSAGSTKALWTASVDVPEAAQALANNIPPLNRAVVEYARQNLGRSVRDGDCTHLAEECLKAAGAGKRGVYQWGRELDER
ncbi:MAG: hypothetical protein ACREJM_11365, partial [Candidatus Saccharimonadales bacterium]